MNMVCFEIVTHLSNSIQLNLKFSLILAVLNEPSY